ncbi:hypothetical protein PF005_g17062 [Phytophthora fragariae]|uniref:Uncharacterized protein n=1 Tax=Phytophthora fragariae TaxID=53985 RepID=A0A6A3JNQ7_9STRA|nr:hypothetical protein PF003_g22933 [Phytophthora fragariae]KAE8927489.1 hypothetical protein PF009_g22348 [Phytophthora fragariae]KAE8993814.1 hypothetical protein PF011_g16987 [Phytophthora fragariae]KAE9091905.1 hypothetical protein PF010_g18009 [Phytophthora fragariae]KAE9093472.1 hypothetical protein PF007_g18119 [Phytophthora fragariae]
MKVIENLPAPLDETGYPPGVSLPTFAGLAIEVCGTRSPQTSNLAIWTTAVRSSTHARLAG